MRFSSVVTLAGIMLASNLFITTELRAEPIELQLLTHNTDNAILIDEKGNMHGIEGAGLRAFYVELVRAVLEEIGDHASNIRDVPFKRGLKIIDNVPNAALFNIARTQSRINQYKWVGPIWKFQDFFYEAADAPTMIETLDDAKDMTVCALSNGSHESKLKALQFTNIYSANDYETCFRMLAKKRVQLTASARSSVQDKIKRAGIDPADVLRTNVIVSEDEGYIAFSMGTDDAVISQWQKALDKIVSSGRYNSIRERFVPEAQ